MNTKQILQIIQTYELTQKLTTTLRRGWTIWHLNNERIQSIAEHVFGTCMLAITMHATNPTNIDIHKVITMLMLHETEEIIIGDLTPYDDRSHKAQDGQKAVLQIFENYPNSQDFISIIQEFDENITPEAKFAQQCDKLEANLYAFLHNQKFDLQKVSPHIMNHPDIQGWKMQGYQSVAEWFICSDIPIYNQDFMDIATYLLEHTKI